MLLSFSVSNYRCFRGLQTLNLAASNQDKSLPENLITTDVPGLEKKKWVKGVGLYGANASGKSTIIYALKALAQMVENSAKMTDPKEPIPQIVPFALCPDQPEEPTAFAVAFVSDNVRYEYRVAATRERIWHESLRAFPKKVEQLWYSRTWNPKSNSYEWTPETPSGFTRDKQLEGYTLSNMLFLSKAVANARADLEPVFRWFKELIFLDLSEGFLTKARTSLTLEMIRDNKDFFGDMIIKLLRYADLGVTNVRILEEPPPSEEVIKKLENIFPPGLHKMMKEPQLMPELSHNASGSSEVFLPWESESAGTQHLLGVVGWWLMILATGRMVCVDELETSMHPLMVRELLRLFFSEKENPKGAQILFTTHNPLLLDTTLLRRDQIWFTDKDTKGEGHLYPLTDYSPRKGESLVRGYLSGRYGAVPFIPEGLLGSFPAHEIINSSKEEKRE